MLLPTTHVLAIAATLQGAQLFVNYQMAPYSLLTLISCQVIKLCGQMSRVPVGESEPRGFESRACGLERWSSQTNNFKIDTCQSLA